MPDKQRQRPWDQGAGLSSRQAVCFCRGGLRIPGLVRRLSRGRGRMVCHVAVTGMEWSAGRLSYPRVNPSGSDLRRPTGPRALRRGPRRNSVNQPSRCNGKYARAVMHGPRGERVEARESGFRLKAWHCTRGGYSATAARLPLRPGNEARGRSRASSPCAALRPSPFAHHIRRNRPGGEDSARGVGGAARTRTGEACRIFGRPHRLVRERQRNLTRMDLNRTNCSLGAVQLQTRRIPPPHPRRCGCEQIFRFPLSPSRENKPVGRGAPRSPRLRV
jgi:hypothetical protein